MKSGLFGQNPFISRYRLRGDALEGVARISSWCVKKMFLVGNLTYIDERRVEVL